MKVTYCVIGRAVLVLEGEHSAPEAALKAFVELRLEPPENNVMHVNAFNMETNDAPREWRSQLEDVANHNRMIIGREAEKLFGVKYDPTKEPN